jgi:archaellum biogenesis protein FlaJ (TadC family)
MTSQNGDSLLVTLLKWFLLAIVAVAAIKLSFWVLGVVFGIGGFLLFTVAPLVVAGWLVMKVVKMLRRKDDDFDTA